MYAAMKTFSERNPLVVGAIGVAVTIGVMLAALNYGKLPFVNSDRVYSAYFAEAGGLLTGAPVQVSGLRAGRVASIDLDGPRVLVTFEVDKNIRLGERTEAAIKTKSVLGAKVLEVSPRGDGRQSGPIPLERTRSPYQLPDALGDLTTTVSGLDTDKLSDSLAVLADTFSETPPALKIALQGVARFSQTLTKRDAQLRNLLANANKVTAVLSERSDGIVKLMADANALLVQLQSQSRCAGPAFRNLAAASRAAQGRDRREQADAANPHSTKLDEVLTILDNRKDRVQSRSRGSTVTRCRSASRCRPARSSSSTSPTCCPGSSFSRSSTPPSRIWGWTRTSFYRRNSPTRRPGSRVRRRCRFHTRAPDRAVSRD